MDSETLRCALFNSEHQHARVAQRPLDRPATQRCLKSAAGAVCRIALHAVEKCAACFVGLDLGVGKKSIVLASVVHSGNHSEHLLGDDPAVAAYGFAVAGCHRLHAGLQVIAQRFVQLVQLIRLADVAYADVLY